MAKINKIRLSGTVYDIQDLNATKTVELTQAQYDALVTGGTVDPNTFYVITDAVGVSVTSSVTINSTDVITSGGVYNALNGLKLVKITAADYALITPDDNTVYFVGDSNGYVIKIGNVSVN